MDAASDAAVREWVRPAAPDGAPLIGDGSFAYFRSAATLSMPAWAQTSSFSPPGAPEMPTAPITSSPALIGSAPCAATMLVRNSAPATGLPLTPAANSPDDLLK